MVTKIRQNYEELCLLPHDVVVDVFVCLRSLKLLNNRARVSSEVILELNPPFTSFAVMKGSPQGVVLLTLTKSV